MARGAEVVGHRAVVVVHGCILRRNQDVDAREVMRTIMLLILAP